MMIVDLDSNYLDTITQETYFGVRDYIKTLIGKSRQDKDEEN